ncbi:hypothetical protein NC652_026660 [Populus alba x Populus x berolinensis]|nr:hypothetical protein NC652_026660 [Populus alba x Populus x berolinensis]
MHLWPTMRIRDSFKIAYLKKLEWNLHRMNNEKKQKSQETSNSKQQRLLDDGDDNSTNQQQPVKTSKVVLICREILMLVTCCYCCFCCGARKINHLWPLYFWVKIPQELTENRGIIIRFLPDLFQFDNPYYLTEIIHFGSFKLVSTKTRNDAVSEGIKPLNLLSRDNISEGGTGIVQFSY